MSLTFEVIDGEVYEGVWKQLCPVCDGGRCDHCNQQGWVDEYDEEQPSVFIARCPMCGSVEGCTCE